MKSVMFVKTCEKSGYYFTLFEFILMSAYLREFTQFQQRTK